MIRLKEKAEPEAVDALTVCDDLAPRRRARGGRRRGLRALAAERRPGGRQRPPLRAHRQGARAAARACWTPRARSRTRSSPTAASARELIERAEAALFQHRPRRRPRRDALDRGRPPRGDRQARGALAGDVGAHRHAVRLQDLDELTGGFQPGNLIVLAARPSMGKSTLATNIAENAAIDHDRPVALFSLEMSETELAHRFIASQAKITSDDLRKGRVKADRWPKVLKAVEKLAQRADLHRRLQRHRHPRDAGEGAPAARTARARPGRRGLPPADARRTAAPRAASSRSARSAAGSRSSRASSRSP